jgi:hypothetical protein
VPPLPSGVIEAFLHPPLAVMTSELIPGLFIGDGVLSRPRGPVPTDAFGLRFSFITVPAGFGFKLGAVKEYENRLLQLAVEHTMLDGHGIISQVTDFHSDNLPFLFDVALPLQVHFSIIPGVSIQFFWLLVL